MKQAFPQAKDMKIARKKTMLFKHTCSGQSKQGRKEPKTNLRRKHFLKF